jgi:F0F1-type ATP synthase assembly protein I
MTTVIKNQISKVTSNAIGSVVGGVATYYIAKKHFHVEKTWMLVGLSIVGIIAGATAQSVIFHKGAPTAATVK